MAGWRRLADWKDTVVLVDRADLSAEVLAALDVGLPEAADPGLARLARAGRHLRVTGEVRRRLRGLGVPVVEVGYHRGSDGLRYVDGAARDVDVGELRAAVMDDDEDDDLWDDIVGAVVSVLSEGTVTEADVLVAAALPALGGGAGTIAACDADTLPVVSTERIDLVAGAMANPRPPPDTLTPQQRRAYQRQAAGVAVIAGLVAVVAWVYAPMLAVVAAPALVLALTIIAVHEAALRQR